MAKEKSFSSSCERYSRFPSETDKSLCRASVLFIIGMLFLVLQHGKIIYIHSSVRVFTKICRVLRITHPSLSLSSPYLSRRYTNRFFYTESIGITAVRTLPNVFHDGYHFHGSSCTPSTFVSHWTLHSFMRRGTCSSAPKFASKSADRSSRAGPYIRRKTWVEVGEIRRSGTRFNGSLLGCQLPRSDAYPLDLSVPE